MSLAGAADLMAPSRSDPMQTNAALAVVRMTSSTTPMPPVGGVAATAAEIAALAAWIDAGYPSATCATGVGADPFSVPSTCTSQMDWSGPAGDLMDPGRACIACHAKSNGAGPLFKIAGTLFPTAHEPDFCYGTGGVDGAAVVVTGADGVSTTLTPNEDGNFFIWNGQVALPYSARVTFMGRERVMVAKQTSGDCNGCHSQAGAMSAPGRILLP